VHNHSELFATEVFGEAKWEEQVTVYTLSSVTLIFIVQSLVKDGILGEGSQAVLVSSRVQIHSTPP